MGTSMSGAGFGKNKTSRTSTQRRRVNRLVFQGVWGVSALGRKCGYSDGVGSSLPYASDIRGESYGKGNPLSRTKFSGHRGDGPDVDPVAFELGDHRQPDVFGQRHEALLGGSFHRPRQGRRPAADGRPGLQDAIRSPGRVIADPGRVAPPSRPGCTATGRPACRLPMS